MIQIGVRRPLDIQVPAVYVAQHFVVRYDRDNRDIRVLTQLVETQHGVVRLGIHISNAKNLRRSTANCC